MFKKHDRLAGLRWPELSYERWLRCGPFWARPLRLRLGCPIAVLLLGSHQCHSPGPTPTVGHLQPRRFLFPSACSSAFVLSPILARAIVLLQASPGNKRLLPSGPRAGCLQGRMSSWCAALSWHFSSLARAFVFIAGCGGPFLSFFCLLFLLSWMFVAFPHGEFAERKAPLTSGCY